VSVPAEALRELLRQLHAGPAQEAAAARVATALWRRAVAGGDAAAAAEAAGLVEARIEALFDQLAEIERHGKALLTEADSA
jgi:predicted nucleic acid-binding protein